MQRFDFSGLMYFGVFWFAYDQHAADSVLEQVQTLLDFIIVPNYHLSAGVARHYIC